MADTDMARIEALLLHLGDNARFTVIVEFENRWFSFHAMIVRSGVVILEARDSIMEAAIGELGEQAKAHMTTQEIAQPAHTGASAPQEG